MIALERKDTTMHITSEAPVNCLQNRLLPCNLQYNKIPTEGIQELKDGVHAHPASDIVEVNQLLNGDYLKSRKETPIRTFNHHEFGAWSAYYPDSTNVKLCPVNAFDAQFYPCFTDNQFRYAPLNVIPQNYPYEHQLQDFQYFVVIDFEATCDKDKKPHPQEIIEFPSVIVSSMTGQLEACFQTYVRPTCNQLLTDFCKDLTGIQQIQVDRGVTLSEALLRHDKWLENKGIKHSSFAVVTWSNWDCQVMLESECRYKKIRKPPYFNKWIDLKVPFREVFGGVRCNLKEAVQMAGLVWQGRPHCGLDDAKNTARLLTLLMHRGVKLSFTDSLICQPTDETFTWKLPVDQPSFPAYQPQKIWSLHVPVLQLHPHCYCGVKSSKGMVRKPGPKQGCLFFGCGNWTATRGARCQYFEWASK